MRLAVENSWLNYTRNCFIATVAGASMYNAIDKKTPDTLLPTKLLIGTGIAYMNYGTFFYVGSLLLFENVTALVVCNAFGSGAISCAYTAASYLFLRNCDADVEAYQQSIEKKR